MSGKFKIINQVTEGVDNRALEEHGYQEFPLSSKNKFDAL
jgi:hypothetical protein